ncbi:MAG TPA: helix-turn-helix domain-containing protein, partial [Vicinamibacterales bacterium]|nr:helix-turn-helix domain-containing protein [Vicinamibacterales bacterium]
GRFRGDLYYRLNIVEIRLPALRDRREDIPILTAAFVDDIARRLHKRLRGVTPAAEGLLTAAPWDGNVRELRNVIERAGILADEELITERELAVSMPPARSARPAVPPAPAGTQKGERLADVEREHIQRALVLVGGNKKAAAQMLGLSRRALYRRLERLNLTASINRRRAATPLGA